MRAHILLTIGSVASCTAAWPSPELNIFSLLRARFPAPIPAPMAQQSVDPFTGIPTETSASTSSEFPCEKLSTRSKQPASSALTRRSGYTRILAHLRLLQHRRHVRTEPRRHVLRHQRLRRMLQQIRLLRKLRRLLRPRPMRTRVRDMLDWGRYDAYRGRSAHLYRLAQEAVLLRYYSGLFVGG